MSELLSKVSIILDGGAPADQIAVCFARLQAIEGAEVIVANSPADSSGAARWNKAAQEAQGEYFLFLRPWVHIDEPGVEVLAETLEREMTIGACAPALLRQDGTAAPQDFILLEDECKRRPIDVLLRPVKFDYAPDWPTCPSTGIAFVSDAIMVRRVAFWASGGWCEDVEDPCLSLNFGLSLNELHWRFVCDRRAAAVTSKPFAEDVVLSPLDLQALVRRWYGHFLPHGLRTPDGIIRSHPWIPISVGAVTANYEKVPSPFVTVPSGASHESARIPGERCSVVIVTYNSMDSLAACISSVLNHLGTFDEAILVDNASRDQTPQFLAELEKADPRIKVVLNEKNLGFSEGCNIGIDKAEGDYIVLLNPDTVVPEGWLGRMRAYFQDPTVGAVGPISNGAYGIQSYAFHFPRNAGSDLSPGDVHDLTTKVNARRGVETKMLIGFCMMISRKVLDTVGKLDPELFLGCDDLDLSWRLRLAGYRLMIASDVFVLHRVHVSFMSEPEQVVHELVQDSMRVFARKLVAYYGEGEVPDQMELWGIDWFLPSAPLAKAA